MTASESLTASRNRRQIVLLYAVVKLGFTNFTSLTSLIGKLVEKEFLNFSPVCFNRLEDGLCKRRSCCSWV